MRNVIIGFILTSVLFIWLLGWWGVAGIVVFLLGAYGYAKSGAKPGKIARFIEKLGVDDHRKNGR